MIDFPILLLEHKHVGSLLVVGFPLTLIVSLKTRFIPRNEIDLGPSPMFGPRINTFGLRFGDGDERRKRLPL